jgi:hypothetical protein
VNETAEHWRALFAGASLCLAGCPRCNGRPDLKCRRCLLELAVLGLSAYHLVNDTDQPTQRDQAHAAATGEGERIAARRDQ